jgi:hypothetical protein
VKATLPFVLAASFLVPAAPLVAQCEGDAGCEISGPDTAPIGTQIDLALTGPANEIGLLMISLGDGPTNSPYGPLCVDFPLVNAVLFQFDGEGNADISGSHPCDPAIVGITVFIQFITAAPSRCVSNMHDLTFVDNICDGALCGFTQGGWGTTCSGGNPGCIRDEFFATVFPNGVVIGDADGMDGDSDFALHFSSSAAVEAFLPANGKPGLLDQDAHNPTDSSAGVFAGQLLAAKLNVGFDDAGALDGCKGREELFLGDLIFVDCVDADLIGMSVRDLIELADAVISGALGAGPYDLDGDGNDDVTVSDLSDALDKFNSNFNGGENNGCLGLS